MFLFVFPQKVEGRVASDQELKLTELLRYYMRDIQAAKVRHFLPSYKMYRFTVMLLVYADHPALFCFSNPFKPDITLLIIITCCSSLFFIS